MSYTVICPYTKKKYERWDYTAYHDDDCPYCKPKKKRMFKFSSLIPFLFLFLPFSSAFTITNTMLYSSGLNTNVSIGSYGWNLTNLTVDTNYIDVLNLTSSHNGEVDHSPFSFEITQPNQFYYGTDAPYWTFATAIKRQFWNNISGLLADISFPVWTCDLRELTLNGADTSYSCSNNWLTLSNKNLSKGTNNILIDYNITLTNCTNGTALNFKAYDEDSLSLLPDVTFDVVVDYWNNRELNTYNLSYSTKQLHGAINQSPAGLCIHPPDLSSFADVYIKYQANNSFTHRYFINNRSFNGTPYNISLYNFASPFGISSLQITVRDLYTYDYYPNIYATLLRYYPSENVWKAVQMDKTGDYGNAIFHIKEQSEDYELKFQDYAGHVLKITSPMKFVCDNGVCLLTVLLSKWTGTVPAQNLSIQYSYLPDTHQIKLTWQKYDGTMAHIKFQVSKELMSGTTYICSNDYYASSGTAYCNVTGYSGEVFVYIEGNDKVYYAEYVKLSQGGLSQYLSSAQQVFFSFIILIVIFALGLYSPVASIITAIIGLVVLYALGLFAPLTLTFIFLVAIMGVVIMMKVRQ